MNETIQNGMNIIKKNGILISLLVVPMVAISIRRHKFVLYEVFEFFFLRSKSVKSYAIESAAKRFPFHESTARKMSGGPASTVLPPFPNSWFRMCRSEDLPIGAVKTVRAFARDLVVFRGEDGKAAVVDAFCPHLGAHLGIGGKVVGQ